MKANKRLFSLTPKILFHVSWLTSIYFVFLALTTYGLIKFEFVLFGVIREIISIPLMITQLVICGWSLYWLIKEDLRLKEYLFWVFVISLCNSIAIVWPFFN